MYQIPSLLIDSTAFEAHVPACLLKSPLPLQHD